jgi:hypothetical protein
MPIVSSEIIKYRDRGNGRLAVFEQHTDHNGQVHEHRYSCPVGHDIDQELLNWIPVLENTLIESEEKTLQQSVESGVDPETITLKHLDNIQKARTVIKALMLGSPEKMLKAAEYVQGFTNTQIENFFTQSQRIRIRERQNYIINNQSVLNIDIREELE